MNILDVLFVVLVLLKLLGVITISWWLVFSPLIVGLLIGLIVLIIQWVVVSNLWR